MGSNTPRIQIFLNLEQYGGVFADKLAQATTTDIRNRARKLVRTDTHKLQGSIQTEKRGYGEYVVFSETDYAAAQEWGRPDLPNYGFTPYMRPAAHEASQGAGLEANIKKADIAAERAARRSR